MKLEDSSPDFFNQTFVSNGNILKREVLINSEASASAVECSANTGDLEKDFFVSRLNSPLLFDAPSDAPVVNYIDLFCGGGGLSLGVHEAIQNIGLRPRLVAAYDTDPMAMSLVRRHFSPLMTGVVDISRLLEFSVDHSGSSSNFVSEPRILDGELSSVRSQVQLLVGGPPCQGHSNLNNRTRRSDERNQLYYVMPAVAIALDIPFVIIENVVAIKASHENVTGIARGLFEGAGYNVEEIVLDATKFGVAQTRRRHFMVASKAQTNGGVNLDTFTGKLFVSTLNFDDINSSIAPLAYHNSFLETPPELSQSNKDRIRYLYENNLFDLPNEERPECHRDGTTYPSVYGRMRPDVPAPTITGGFNTPGRGRFIHPREPRVINIREAGRIQGFPDWYWEPCEELGFKREYYKKIIGDAVPPPLVHPIIFSMAKCLKDIV